MLNKNNAINAYLQAKNLSEEKNEKQVIKAVFPKVSKTLSPLEENFTPKKQETFKTEVSNESAGLIKQGLKVKGYRKAAKFLMLVGKDQASEILKQLSDDEVQNIMKEVATIPKIDKYEADAILNEFKFLKEREELPKGGVDTARSILVQTMGEEAGRRFLKKVVPESEEKPFAFLNEVDPKDLFLIMKNESNDSIALIMQFLEPKKASQLLTMLADKDRVEIAKKIVNKKTISPMVISIVEEKVKEKIRTIGMKSDSDLDGASTLANILKYVDLQTESKILDDLENFNRDISKNVKEKIFTIDMITSIDDTDLQQVLQSFSDEALAVILKGKSEEIEKKILSCVSEKRAIYIREERERLGLMKRIDVDDATKDFLNTLRMLHYQNKIIINDIDEEYI